MPNGESSSPLKVVIQPLPSSAEVKIIIMPTSSVSVLSNLSVMFYIAQAALLCCHRTGSLARDGTVSTPCISITVFPGHHWNVNSLLRAEVVYNTALPKFKNEFYQTQLVYRIAIAN